jgi:hypothetical protein
MQFFPNYWITLTAYIASTPPTARLGPWARVDTAPSTFPRPRGWVDRIGRSVRIRRSHKAVRCPPGVLLGTSAPHKRWRTGPVDKKIPWGSEQFFATMLEQMLQLIVPQAYPSQENPVVRGASRKHSGLLPVNKHARIGILAVFTLAPQLRFTRYSPSCPILRSRP